MEARHAVIISFIAKCYAIPASAGIACPEDRGPPLRTLLRNQKRSHPREGGDRMAYFSGDERGSDGGPR